LPPVLPGKKSKSQCFEACEGAMAKSWSCAGRVPFPPGIIFYLKWIADDG
jgi:hypothetical protein